MRKKVDCLCGLVVRVPGYRSRGPRFDSRLYQIFWEVVGLERGPLSPMSTIEELPGRNNSGFGLEIWEYGLRDSLHWPCYTLYPQTCLCLSIWSNICKVATCAIMKKWKWLLVKGCKCDSLITAARAFLNLYQAMGQVHQCAWGIRCIILIHHWTSWTTFNIVMTSYLIYMT
jgi:hypothetical protein